MRRGLSRHAGARAGRGPGLQSFLDRSRSVGAVLVVGALVTLGMWLLATLPYRLSGVVLVLPVLLLISAPLLQRAVRGEVDPRIGRLILLAFGLKMLSAFVRYAVAVLVYDGNADAISYHDWGDTLAPLIRSGQLVPDFGRATILGTGFVRMLTGYLYTFTGPALIGGFVVFTWFGFWGLYFFHRAFVTAMPDGDHWLHARLVFLLPSLLFWPSSIGKEAWVVLCLGLASLGAAKILVRAPHGFYQLVLGVGGVMLVRPHIAPLFVSSLAAALVLRRSRQLAVLSPVLRLGGAAVVLAAVYFVATTAGNYFGATQLTADNVVAVVDEAGVRTDQGGSAFTATQVRSPTDLPLAVATVLLRPFPWEARNAQGILTSLEGAFVAFLIFRRRRSWWQPPGILRRRPYAALAAVYALVFVIAFSSFGNFGILTRQRVQLVPFVLVLLCLPTKRQQELAAPARLPPERVPVLDPARGGP